MKGYYVCSYGDPQWWTCYGVLENGFCFGQHLCTHPDFAPGDLFERRPERQKALEKVFGLSPSDIDFKLIVVKSNADIPTWWDEHDKLQDALKPAYEHYGEILGHFNLMKKGATTP